MEHIEAAISWLCAAQDAFDDGGVARSYALVHIPYLKRRGWIHSYPETTGYIIPTIFDYAKLRGSNELFDRAVRMADWECEVQMENGAVQGGAIDQKPTPAVFNTGQVIFGWLRAYQETGNQKYLDSAIRAAEFLLSVQDPNGAWRKMLSNYASGAMPFYSYNTRTAWALCLLSAYTQDTRYREAGVRNVDFTLGQQLENGWFENNCLTDPSEPLLHTIAYCIRGILEVGILLANDRYIRRAQLAADAVLSRMRDDGMLSGRFDRNWRPTVAWSCLSGNAQISIIWSRLYRLRGGEQYIAAVQKANSFLKRRQLMFGHIQHLHGGMCGSYPVQGEYLPYEIVNWGTKFFLDALLEEKRSKEEQADSSRC
jgi:uncharacterized protein YyaL (SSP411 family)